MNLAEGVVHQTERLDPSRRRSSTADRAALAGVDETLELVRLGGLGGGVGHVLARRIGLVEPRLHVLGFGALTVFAGFLLAAVLIALLAFLLVRPQGLFGEKIIDRV